MASSSPPPPPRTNQTAEYYYFFIAVAAIAVMLLVSNIIAVGCCSPTRVLHAICNRLRRRTTMAGDPETSHSHEQQAHHHLMVLIPLCKYSRSDDKDQQSECSVCLSFFIEGEEVRQLPTCKHLFHVPCIDMWLFSHSNCPLCRADVLSVPSSRSSRLRSLTMEPRTDADVVEFQV